jgi:hypothetical protein
MPHHHKESPAQFSQESISWEIKTRPDREHNDWFYIITLSATILLLLFSVWQKDFLFGVFVILASGTILFLSTQRAEVYKFELTPKEIIIGENENVYPYEKFSHFDIYEYNPEEIELFLVFKDRFKAILRIRIYKGDSEKIKEFISKKLPQKKTEPSMMDIFSKIVGI